MKETSNRYLIKHPNLNFLINKSEDKKICFHFINHKNRGKDFSQIIIRSHPKLKSIKNNKKKEQKAIISKYVDDFYKRNINEIKNRKILIEKMWNKIKDMFFLKTNRIFSCKWPKGNYRAYMTIFNIAPRNIADKSFYLPYRSSIKNIEHIIIHEMLHFIFYYYFYKNFRKKRLTRKNLWRLSEIFNEAIMNSEFKEFYIPKEFSDSEKRILEKYKNIWNNSNNVNDFILKLVYQLKL